MLEFLEKRKIAISDTIVKCERTSLSALDKDLIPLDLNYKLIDDINNAEIEQILFTSGYGKNNAFKIFFKDILGLRINSEIRESGEALIAEPFFKRRIKLQVLYSPSNMANLAISRSKNYLENKHLFQDSPRPVYDYKIWLYKQYFT